jgi:hypothetical protein
MTRGTQLNGGGFRAGVFCPDQVNLFCDVQAQEQWRLDLMSKLTSRILNNNHLVQGQVLFVVSDQDVYDSKVWDDPEALSGGVDGCLITGEPKAGPRTRYQQRIPTCLKLLRFKAVVVRRTLRLRLLFKTDSASHRSSFLSLQPFSDSS